MLKERGSGDDLVIFDSSCVIFKKYNEYNLWFGSFGEYANIKYCKKYIQKYIYCWIHIFLLERFSLFFVRFLYRSPCFIKFIESGFLKYLDYDFLLLFHNNCFSFDLKGKQKIRVFVKSYFQSFLEKRLEKDFLILLTQVINEIILNVLSNSLTKRSKDIHIYMECICLKNKISFKLVTKLNNLYKSLSINSRSNKNLKFNLKSVKVSKLIMEKPFIGFPRKVSYVCNRDIHHLVESFEVLGGLNKEEKNIGIYININLLSEEFLNEKKLELLNTIFFFKSFNNYFVKYRYERTLDKEIFINTLKTSKYFNLI